MRICLVTRHMDFRTAGLGRVSLEIRNGLVKHGHSVHTVRTNGTSLYSYFFYTLAEIPLRLPKDVDVYHAITPIEGMWLPKKKSVVTFHDLIIVKHPDKLGSGIGYSKWKNVVGRAYNKFVISISKRCCRITAVSEETKEDLISCLGVPEEKIVVIRSGIRPDLIPMKKKGNKFRIGYLGALDRRKRVHLLIRAFRESKIDAELVIGGIGLDGKFLKSLSGEDERIKFLGLIPDNELVDFYNNLDVLVFPTMIEGYGLPIVEAMACKKPVVVLDDSIIPWDVKSRCVIVDNLKCLIGNRSYLERRCKVIDYESNYLWAKSHDWNKAIDAYVRLYEEILSG